MNRIVTIRIGYEQKFNPDLPEDLWTRRQIACNLIGRHARHGGRKSAEEPATFTWGDMTLILPPEKAAAVFEVLQGIRSLDHAIVKWEAEK
jgi:hypothetical protein